MFYSIQDVQEGRYTFWTYEHLMYPTGLVSTKKSVADKLALRIQNFDAPIQLGSMHCSRASDGGVVYHN